MFSTRQLIDLLHVVKKTTETSQTEFSKNNFAAKTIHLVKLLSVAS